MSSSSAFDIRLAIECATAFSGATSLGCVVSGADGTVLHESGYGCASCGMCRAAKRRQEMCVQSQIYGMTEAERFGGKYIYFCPMGFTCFVSPILGSEGSEAKITVGPFLMVERQDYIACDLMEQMKLPPDLIAAATAELANVPLAEPEKVNQMSTLLFMAVGFMNNVSAASRMLNTQSSDAIQGQVTAYIQQLKGEQEPPPYPFETERALLRAIAQSEKAQAQKLLNELFGYIFFAAAGDFEQAKSRIYELLVLISRTAVDAGADPARTLRLSHTYLHDIPLLHNIDALCFWLTGVMNDFMDSVFNYMDAKHANVIHQSVQYLNAHYAEHITLDEMAARVYLSPAYFSRVFKQETGCTFTAYLNKTRIERSKEMLLHQNIRLTDIALLVGFEDQSYFTKVFKKMTGTAPLKYRETKGQAKSERRKAEG
ncbi:MAG: helix-turn-helix domain-containing protein [Ruthenibacterium sp.]